jgi:hypothetical protein
VTGLAATSETTETKVKVDALILGDRHIISEIYAAAGIVKPTIVTISGELGYRKVCARECRNAHCRIQNSPSHPGGGGPVQNFSSAVAKAEMLFCQEKL